MPAVERGARGHIMRRRSPGRAQDPLAAEPPERERALNNLLVNELRKMCAEKGLDTTGRKAELVALLLGASASEQALVRGRVPNVGRVGSPLAARGRSPGQSRTPTFSDLKKRALELGAEEGEVNNLSDDAIDAGDDPRGPILALIERFESEGVLTVGDAMARALKRPSSNVTADPGDPSTRVIDLLYDVDGKYRWPMWVFVYPCVFSLASFVLYLYFNIDLFLASIFPGVPAFGSRLSTLGAPILQFPLGGPVGSLSWGILSGILFTILFTPAVVTVSRRSEARKKQEEFLYYLGLSDVKTRATTVTMRNMKEDPWIQDRRADQRAIETRNHVSMTAALSEGSNQLRHMSLRRSLQPQFRFTFF